MSFWRGETSECLIYMLINDKNPGKVAERACQLHLVHISIKNKFCYHSSYYYLNEKKNTLHKFLQVTPANVYGFELFSNFYLQKMTIKYFAIPY